MFTLTTQQASTWGYSIIQYPAITNVTTTGTITNLGVFTKLILAPNGNMYAISIHDTTTISGTGYNGAFLKVIPGITNTRTTNWSAATFSYITPDGTANDDNGFGKQPIPVGNGNDVNFNTGVLATNGLIYFPPNTGVNWVVFNPATEKWKITDQYRPSNVTSIAANSINCAVLGTDNKIYVLGSASTKSFRIITSTLAANDTIEDSYYSSFYGTSSPLGNTTMTWKDPNNTSYTDTNGYPTTGLEAAYKIAYGGTYLKNLNRSRDVLVHPSGKIFMIPTIGRGRIFYIDQNQWGTERELVSEPNYYIQNISGFDSTVLEGGYLILEKPRDADHNVNTLKIYVVPTCTPSNPPTSGAPGNPYGNTYLLVIDPVAKTMTTQTMYYSKAVGTATSYSGGMGPKINLPNGHSVVYNNYSGTFTINRQGGVIISGKDVPSTVTTGAKFLTAVDKNIFQEDVAISKLTPLSLTSPGYTGLNGSCTPSWPHNSKTIIGGRITSGNEIQYTEIVSVKGYGPDITNFNFSERDKSNYQLTPSNLSTLGSTIYNSQYNNPK